MGYQVIRQPDGKLAIFSSYTDTWAVYDAEPGEVVEWFASRPATDARVSAQRTVDAVLAGEDPGGFFAMTFEEANAMSGEHGGVVLPGAEGAT